LGSCHHTIRHAAGTSRLNQYLSSRLVWKIVNRRSQDWSLLVQPKHNQECSVIWKIVRWVGSRRGQSAKHHSQVCPDGSHMCLPDTLWCSKLQDVWASGDDKPLSENQAPSGFDPWQGNAAARNPMKVPPTTEVGGRRDCMWQYLGDNDILPS